MEKQIMPLLRFPEFTDNWVTKKLNNLGTVVNGLTYSPNDVNDNGVLVLRSSNIQNNQLSFEDNVYVNADDFNEVLENDILICVRNGSKRLIGKNVLIPKNIEGVAFGAFMSVYRSKYNKFIFQLFATESYQRTIYENLGATINSINNSEIKKFQFNFPSILEQQKIASFLTDIDAKITKLTKKKKLLEEYKKGVMQKIFNQELRFKDDDGNDFPEWEEKRLGNICEMTSSKRVYISDYVEEGIPFYRGKEISDIKMNRIPSDILYISESRYNDFKDKYGVPKINDILITAVGTLGNVLRIANDDKFYFKDGNLIWLKSIKEESKFLEILLQYSTPKLLKTAIGSSQKALTMVELRKLRFLFPSVEEQTKIATFLLDVDLKIQAINTKIENSKTFKKGLLQQMFV